MGRKKRIRIICSDEDYLSQQGGSDSHAQANDPLPIESEEPSIELEEPSEGVEVLFEDNQGNRTRGKTLLTHLWTLPAGHRVVVDANDLHQPIGAEVGLLGQFLGTISRNGRICSLSHKNWFFLIKVAKENILCVVK
ncbi:E3 ubiquitin-protein ligase CHIP [Rhynchospora pubera]|uniref:E3 ubiquitin-protein ligase CHIP n=1 Tax=Rhynchospora pubera TaxID=906938 RepID=A0AAV8CSN4_9POAL|nr:E3 ubiquitin-protein ligase CHIP [Rhynchospora pubera]